MDYFYEYVRTFNLDDKNISLKYHHSIRVMKKMLFLSHELSLNEEDTYLAKMIGLLHDIGRFYQITAYHTFSDHILDHGDYGANLLIKEKLIKKFKIKEEDYPVVYTSIKYHNKYKIPSTLSPREELFLKMIRDADKIDIFYILSNNKNLIIDNIDISKNIISDFYKKKPINYRDIKNNNDRIILSLAMSYDLNYSYSCNYLIKNNIIKNIYNLINNKTIFKEYFHFINEYLIERSGYNVR